MTQTIKNVSILGSTGSIGCSTLKVLARQPTQFSVFALTAQRQVELLVQQCVAFRPRYAVIADAGREAELRTQLAQYSLPTIVLSGAQGISFVATHAEVDVVMAAIVGAAGLVPILAAAAAGKRICLANKEVLVMAGALFMQTVRQGGATLLPVDSEHNAIFQCLPAALADSLCQGTSFRQDTPSDTSQLNVLHQNYGLRHLILTASGGPFRDFSLQQMQNVTPEAACAHPNWQMGQKISVDSATQMNKGLELIEAYWLFSTTIEQLSVVIHPQSIVHSMVEYADGSVLAQMGCPDMQIPITYALNYPVRGVWQAPVLDLARIGTLTFSEPDYQRFPCLGLAYNALKAGGSAMIYLNACNEIAVSSFLAGGIPFLAIATLIERCLDDLPAQADGTIDDILAADQLARRWATDHLADYR